MRMSSLVFIVLTVVLLPPAATTADAMSSAHARAQQAVWAREQAIYAGRGRGDLTPYLASTATDFSSWPPQTARPVDYAALKASAASLANSREKLEMTLVEFRLNGTTAVIYYRTHRTMRADGTVADDHYEVTHTWVREGGNWCVMGGMSRLVVPAQRALE
jgi:hypothetical protein